MSPPVRRGEVVSVANHATEHLRVIRDAMERSGTFTAVPGAGGAGMGAIGLLAAAVATQQPTRERWLLVWLAAAVLAFVIGLVTMQRKARRLGVPLVGAAARRFAVSLAAPLVAGAALTWGLWRDGAWSLLPGTWLLLYGAGVLTGGAFSVPPVRALGMSFMALGVLATTAPAAWGNWSLAAGFGGLQLIFGIYIARRYGG